jgi:hypothetical protein
MLTLNPKKKKKKEAANIRLSELFELLIHLNSGQNWTE